MDISTSMMPLTLSKSRFLNESYGNGEIVIGLIREKLDVVTTAVRLVPLSTYLSEKKCEDYGSSTAHIFAFEVN